MAIAMQPKPEGETLQFMRRLWALAHGLEVRSKRMATTLGVTGPQRLVLRVIGQRPHCTPGTIAQTLRMHPSTLTGILSRLQRRGLVARQRDPEDHRRVFLVLTSRGVEVNRVRRGTVEDAVNRALAGLDPDRVAIASELLTLVAAELLRDEKR